MAKHICTNCGWEAPSEHFEIMECNFGEHRVVLNQAAYLQDFFEFETCGLCGEDADCHRVGPNQLGLPHVYCLDDTAEVSA